MSLSFLGKKSFHPSNPQNAKKLWQAEEQQEREARKKEELKREHEAEETRRQSRAMLEKGAPAEAPSSMNFMYQLPPGLKEAQDRQKRQAAQRQADDKAAAAAAAASTADGEEPPPQTKAERDAERFAILKHAPTAGEYTKDIEVRHRPFGVELRNVKCRRCGEWGHSAGDRECKLRNEVTAQMEESKAKDDPLARNAGAEASGGQLRWAPKAATSEGVHGGLGRSDANQQFVVDEDEEAMAAMMAMQTAAGGEATMADLDPAVLALLDEKQRKKLLKMYQKEQRRGDDGDDGERKRKKHKHEKREHKHKKHKSKHHKSSRRDDSGSGSESRS